MTNIEEGPVQKPKSKRIFYLDALRALAILSVIIIHVAASTQYLVNGNSAVYPFLSRSWFLNDIMALCFRIGVVLFLMLAGALSLGRSWDIKTFLGRRIPRIVLPFAFWGLVLSILIALYVWYVPNGIANFSAFYLSRIEPLLSYDLMGFLTFLYNYYMAYSYTSYAYWFFWMILGTYLIMPIFDKWVANSNLNELEYFLFFWLITCIFDFTLKIQFPIKLTYFVSPIGLVVLGYYLRHTERKWLNNPYIALLLIIAACACEIAISATYSTPDSIYKLDRYSIFTAIEVIGIWQLFKNIGKFNIHIRFFENPDGIFRRAISGLAKNSYGIYLVQYFMIAAMDGLVTILGISTKSYPLTVFLIFVLSTFLSWALIELLSYIPGLGKAIGSK